MNSAAATHLPFGVWRLKFGVWRFPGADLLPIPTNDQLSRSRRS
jgi:hypothetical protein